MTKRAAGIRLCGGPGRRLCIRDTPCEDCDCKFPDMPALVFNLRHERNFWSWKHSRRVKEIEELLDEP